MCKFAKNLFLFNCCKWIKGVIWLQQTWIISKNKCKEEISIRPFYSPLIFGETKFNLKVKSLSIIYKWYLHLRYLWFLSLYEMKCSSSKPTISSSVNTWGNGEIRDGSIYKSNFRIWTARRTLVKFLIITENTFVIYFQKQLCVSRVQFIRQRLKIA